MLSAGEILMDFFVSTEAEIMIPAALIPEQNTREGKGVSQ
jgi:hypothetical protein